MPYGSGWFIDTVIFLAALVESKLELVSLVPLTMASKILPYELLTELTTEPLGSDTKTFSKTCYNKTIKTIDQIENLNNDKFKRAFGVERDVFLLVLDKLNQHYADSYKKGSCSNRCGRVRAEAFKKGASKYYKI